MLWQLGLWLFFICQKSVNKQAEKLKSCEMKEEWMKNDEVGKNDEGRMMKDDDFKLYFMHILKELKSSHLRCEKHIFGPDAVF